MNDITIHQSWVSLGLKYLISLPFFSQINILIPGHGICRLHDLSSIAKLSQPGNWDCTRLCILYFVHVLLRCCLPSKPHECEHGVHSVKSDHFEPKTFMKLQIKVYI